MVKCLIKSPIFILTSTLEEKGNVMELFGTIRFLFTCKIDNVIEPKKKKRNK